MGLIRSSIGILTAGGSLCCGDLLDNLGEPSVNSILDDMAACEASLERQRSLEIASAFPVKDSWATQQIAAMKAEL